MNSRDPDPVMVACVDAAVRQRDATQEKDEVYFRCPNEGRHNHGDADPSARWNPTKATWYCDPCHDGGGTLDLARRLGIETDRNGRGRRRMPQVLPGQLVKIQESLAKAAARKGGRRAKFARATIETTYAIRNAEGRLVAEHLRYDPAPGAEGAKYFRWRREGRNSLGGLEAAALPLYRSEDLKALADGAVVLVTEGEKAADALRRRGIPAVGTVCGAGTTPFVAPLQPLVRLDPVLWADNDRAGEDHMMRIAGRLLDTCKAARVRILRWPEAPKKGDAFDFFEKGGTMEEFHILLDASAPVEVTSQRAAMEEPPGPRESLVPPAATSSDMDASPVDPEGDYILVPGQHLDDRGTVHEVGTDDFAETVLARLPLGALYRMDCVVGELVGERGAMRFSALAEHRLRVVVDAHVKLAKWVKNRHGDILRVFVACNRDQAGVLLAAAGASPRVPEVRLLVHHPVYGPDLELARPGWNPDTAIYYDEPAALDGLTPRPEGAVEVLRDLVVDFPFQDEASRQNGFGLMLTPLVRPAVEKVPFHMMKAPLERTGKGKFVDTAVGEAVLGHSVAPMQVGKTEEEREKRITSLILAGDTFVHLDNLPVGEVLDSPALASLATAWPRWRGRKLGVSFAPSLPNNLVVVLSGNNPKLTGEITKRTVPIVLEPLDAHPEDRLDVVHPEAETYARSRRREVLEALLGLVESWKTAGRPTGHHGRRMGGFEAWVHLVGDVLHHAGLTEWMGNYRAWVRIVDDWTSDAESLVEKWAEKYGEETRVSASQVLEMVKEIGVFPSVTSRKESGQGVALARTVLTPLVDRPVGHWVVRRAGKGGSVRYRLTRGLPTGENPSNPPDGEGTGRSPGLPFGATEGLEGSEGFLPEPTHVRAHARATQPVDIDQRPSKPSEPSASPPPLASATPPDPEVPATPGHMVDCDCSECIPLSTRPVVGPCPHCSARPGETHWRGRESACPRAEPLTAPGTGGEA